MEKSIHVLMLILVLLVLESASLASNFSSLSHADECSLLFQFKESMSINSSVSTFDSRPYPNVASWNLNGSDGAGNCCLWDGVECRFGHVIGLDLSSSFLYGPISSNNSLFNLIHLRTLNLANNDFRSSQIPSGIGRLSQLINLNLSSSVFSGEVPKQISHLRNLVSLDLSRNYEGLKLHSSDFQNLVQNTSETLRELFLSWVNIDFVPDSLVNSSSLTSLVMSDCGLSGDFPTGILYLQKLQVLDVGYNRNLTGYIPEFHGNSELKQLITGYTNFQGSIPASIGNLTHLNVLDLRFNAFTGTLPASVSNLTQLTHLDLSFNKLTGSLPSLESFSNLTSLYLMGNNFDRWKLPDWFGKLNKITHLYLTDANLYGEIPSSFFNLTQLENLYLYGNQLKGELPISLLNLQNLVGCNLDGNNITVDFYLFLSLKKLENLNLNGNNISLSVIDSHTNETQPKFKELGLASCNLQVFHEFLRFQHQLEHLNLDNNNIEGLIPGWMWNISKETLIELSLAHNLLMGFEQHSPVASWVSLQNLDLSHNMLHGSIPVPPPSTIMYHVSNNNLTGEIPPSICDSSFLQLLDLSFNNITGSIPPCLEKLSNTSLTVLNLRSNTLQGTIPNIFTTESKLEMIDLSENKLEGHVPRSLENCESLQLLDLGYNFLEGTFPFWLGALSELQVLILRFNKFHGIIRIPGNIKVSFPKLRIIDLSNNLFSGDLPHQYFQEWSAMKETMANTIYMQTSIEENREEFSGYISYEFSIQMTNKGVKTDYEKISEALFAVDLSGNMFRGNIPESITTLSGLQLLNLSNNELSGVIPPSMGNLICLESLDLSGNKLSGMIPQDLVRLNFLAVFSVSHNRLTGEIPPSICELLSLGSLDLSFNNITGSIPPCLKKSIEYFSVSNNRLTGEIPPSICDLLSLYWLDLSFNNITGLIPPCLKKLSNSLVGLNLRRNTFQGTIPNIFTNGSKHQIIDLSENKLEGKVPRSLENCVKLQILDLGYNLIEDMFPFWLGALSELQVLILRFNKFHGTITIPSKMKFNFPKLHIIDLSYNAFYGDLPHQYFQEWSAMKEPRANELLEGYSFSIQMTNKGVKMEYVKNIKFFSAVDFSSNMFRGKIPESVTTLGGLQSLNLSNNAIDGVIPQYMGNLTNLESLDLSSNKLSGKIPQELVQLNFLGVLNLSNNKLIGPIPQGRHFDTFSNDSYMGNKALCGFPLSMKCGDSEASKPPKVPFEEDTEPDFPNGIDWVVILIGVVTGLVIGLVCGDYLTTKYCKCFSQRFRMRRR